MKVINITKLKVKYKIELDNGKHFYVSEDTIVKYGLIKRVELSSAQLKEIIEHESEELAFTKATRYLAYGMRTEQDMRKYLEEKEIVSNKIDIVIDRLKKFGYINDEEYIRAAVNDYFNLNKRGPYWIKRKLIEKGLEEEVITNYIDDICTEELQIDYVYRIIEKEFNIRKESKNKKIQKITHKLYTNGYSSDIIRKVFDIFFEDYEDDSDEIEMLEIHFNKAYKNYSKKYDGYELKQKITQKLMRDGFSYYDIQNFLETQDL